MSDRISAETPVGREYFRIDREPDICPACRHACTPTQKLAYCTGVKRPATLQIVYLCPNEKCHSLFVAYFDLLEEKRARLDLLDSLPCRLHRMGIVRYQDERQFSDRVTQLSPGFCEIYHQAQVGEANGLLRLAGPGYRKALEFLVKDYVINHLMKDEPERQQQIGRLPLSACIINYIKNDEVREAAKRAAWLGNDETHYVRAWKDRDLQDLRNLVDMTVSWVELMLASKAYELLMPSGRVQDSDSADGCEAGRSAGGDHRVRNRDARGSLPPKGPEG